MTRVTPRGDASFPGCVGDTLVLRCLGCHPVAGPLRQHREETPGGAALFFFCGVGSARQPPTRLALFIVLLLLVGTLLPARFCLIGHVSSSGGVAVVAHTVIQDVVRHPGAVLTTATCDRASSPILPSGRLLGQRAHLPVRHTPLVHEAGSVYHRRAHQVQGIQKEKTIRESAFNGHRPTQEREEPNETNSVAIQIGGHWPRQQPQQARSPA